jgi:ferric-dicitrate binding protein FerR (iron transport regulator)
MSKARQIIETYFKNTHPKSVQKSFATWLKDKQNSNEKNEILLEIWDKLEVEADQSTEASYKKLQTRIAAHTQKRKAIPLPYKLLRIAALFLLPVVSCAITYLYMKTYTPEMSNIQLVEYIVPNGEMRTIILPDSSKVQLNSGSTLIYPQHFGKTRDIYLNGEAYFSVVHNVKRPFIVKTMDMEIEVLGTTFNVSAYTDSENSSATLGTGKVNVRFKDPHNKPVILMPNEQVSYNRILGLVEKQTVKVENEIAWTKGNLIIQRMSIEEIVKIIERRYALKVYLNSNKYKDAKVTMKFTEEEGVTDCMNVLQYIIPNLRYKIENDKLYIY